MRLLTLATVGLTLTGCATAAAPAPVPTRTGTGLVFQIADQGLAKPMSKPVNMPGTSLYGDGRLILRGSTPLAPVIRQLTPAGVHRVVQAAVDAGLAGPTDYGTPRNVDSGPTRFTLVTAQRHTTRVLFVRDAERDADVNPAQRAARQKLRAFVTRLEGDLDGWLGADIAPGTRPYQYPSVAVFAEPSGPQPSASAWPLADLGTAGTLYEQETYSDLRCQVLAAADVPKAPPFTVWRSGGRPYRVNVRPLLPDEKSCGDLT